MLGVRSDEDRGLDVTELGQAQLEQAALRRVATLVAEGVPAAELFAAVTEEVARSAAVSEPSVTRAPVTGATAAP